MATYTCEKCGSANGKAAKKCKKCGCKKLLLKNPPPDDPEPSPLPEGPTEIELLALEEEGSYEGGKGVSTPDDPGAKEAPDFFNASSGGALRVKVIKGPDNGLAVDLVEGNPVTIGALPASDFHLVKDPFVSKRHAVITLTDGMALVSDDGSSNGVYIRVRDHQPIQEGDEILVGKTLLQLVREK